LDRCTAASLDAFNFVGTLARAAQLGDHGFDIALARKVWLLSRSTTAVTFSYEVLSPSARARLLVGSFGCGELGNVELTALPKPSLKR
jgi:hypothetical protein